MGMYTERAKKDAIQNAARVSDLLVDAVNSGVQESFINEKRIEREIRALAVTIARFMKQTNQWLTTTHVINTAVKVRLFIFFIFVWSFLFLNYCQFACLNVGVRFVL